MVGHPKHLSDLDKIEADVRIICRACGYEHDWDSDSLRRWLGCTGGSTVWTEITRGMVCRRKRCGGRNLFAIPVPFSRRPANEPVKLSGLERELLERAMSILADAARRSTSGPVGEPAVRLALLIAYLFDRDPADAAEFWEVATRTERRGSVSCHRAYEGIRRRLARRGLIARQPGDG